MKNLLTLVVCLTALAVSAAEHENVTLIQGPTIIGITNDGSSTPSILNTTVSTTLLGGGGSVQPQIYYTNALGYSLLANTNYYFYVTNTIPGDTTDTGWRTNRSGVNNVGPFVDVAVWGDANGDAGDLAFSVTYSKTGTATHGTNSMDLMLTKSYDGVNFDAATAGTMRINSTVSTTAKTTISTNLSVNFLQGVKKVRLTAVCAAAASGSISTFTLHSANISGFKP